MTDPRSLKIDDFNYPLPDERIAKYPLAERDRCRLLVRRPDGSISDGFFSQLPQLLPPDSTLVYNNTRVINARLRFRKGENADGAQIEVFCLEPCSPSDYEQNFASTDCCSWHCFVGNSKRWKDSTLTMSLAVDGRPLTLSARRLSKDANASTVEFSWNVDADITFSQIIAAAGEIPIPPYLNRSTEESDLSDYQTVFSRIEGSVAAPTAGLHFTDRVLDDIAARGIPSRELTLHVGAGTFQPVKADNIGDHPMHSEFIAVGRALISEIATSPRRIVAVGTTSVRTLESLFHIGRRLLRGLPADELTQWEAYDDPADDISVEDAMNAILRHLDHIGSDTLIASTRIIIAPGYKYRIVKGMVTNFHQPQSTLLLLVSAFVDGHWREIYDYALARDFRFLSYGDACLLLGD